MNARDARVRPMVHQVLITPSGYEETIERTHAGARQWAGPCVGAWVVASVLLGSQGAWANMRAPRSKPQGSSAALLAQSPVQGLTVMGETLQVQCTRVSCSVVANYRVHAAAPQGVSLAFVLPDGVPVSAHVNGLESVAQVAALEQPSALDRWAAKMDSFLQSGGHPTLYQARFDGHMQEGANDIEVRYTQPLATHERDFGYFKQGRLVSIFRYELWPIKQWVLSPDFVLDAKVLFVPDPAISTWKRLWSPAQALQCRTVSKPVDEADALAGLAQRHDPWPGTPEQRTAQFGAGQVPDRLVCELGDDDLLWVR